MFAKVVFLVFAAILASVTAATTATGLGSGSTSIYLAAPTISDGVIVQPIVMHEVDHDVTECNTIQYTAPTATVTVTFLTSVSVTLDQSSVPVGTTSEQTSMVPDSAASPEGSTGLLTPSSVTFTSGSASATEILPTRSVPDLPTTLLTATPSNPAPATDTTIPTSTGSAGTSTEATGSSAQHHATSSASATSAKSSNAAVGEHKNRGAVAAGLAGLAILALG